MEHVNTEQDKKNKKKSFPQTQPPYNSDIYYTGINK